jgi:methionyl-tRNA formyltransferase
MRVLLFTSQDIGFEVTKGLYQQRGLSLFVVTDRSRRDDLYGYRSAIDFCQDQAIPCIEAIVIDDETYDQIASFGPDIIVSAYYPHMIAQRVISLARRQAINLHPGILPFYRGKFPTPWYILNGEKQFGLAIHKLDKGVDTGDVFVQELYDMPEGITGHELYRLTMAHGAELISRHLLDIAAGRIEPRRQQGVGSYYGTFDRRFQIDWGQSWRVIERRIRVHAKPYLPAYSQLLNRFVFINRARAVDVAGYTSQLTGRIVDVRPSGEFIVTCADGCLLIEEYEVAPSLASHDTGHYLRINNRFD